MSSQPTKELRDTFNFDAYLLVTRVLVDGANMQDRDIGSSSSSRESHVDELIFTKPEDAIFYSFCDWSFTVPSQRVNEAARKDKLKPLRLCMYLKADQVKACRRKIDSL